MSNVWFWADPHFHHKNICELSSRPFSSVEEMNEKLIENFNSVVKQGDRVFCLGDFSFARREETEKVYNRLNKCQHHLILGNHDGENSDKLPWNWIKQYYELRTNGIKFVLFHYPIQSWNGAFHGAIHLHGHSHGNVKSTNIKRMDVGVDCTDYKPINLDEVIAKMKDCNHRFTEET